MTDMEQRLNAEYDAWFAKLKAAAEARGGYGDLVAEDWTEAWFDGYTPEQALDDDARNA